MLTKREMNWNTNTEIVPDILEEKSNLCSMVVPYSEGALYLMEFVVQATGVTDRLTLLIAAPHSGHSRFTIAAFVPRPVARGCLILKNNKLYIVYNAEIEVCQSAYQLASDAH